VAALWLWVSREGRRRVRSILVLAVLVALAGGVVMAAVAGARRDSTAFARLERTVLPNQAWILANQPGFDWSRVRALPEVKTMGLFAVSDYTIDADPTHGMAAGFPPASPEAMRDIERPLVTQGRLPDQSRPDEAFMSSDAAAYGFHVGQVLTLRGFRADKFDGYADNLSFPQQGDGPAQRVTIVGAGKGSSIFQGIVPTYAFFVKYRANVIGSVGYVNALLRLRHGESDIPRLQADTTRLFGHPVEIKDQVAEAKRFTHATDVETDALLAFALAAGLAALALIGQAMVRLVNTAAADVPMLRALGFRSGQVLAAVVAVPLAAGVTGALAAVPVAYALSPRFPIGLGRRLEPSPGFHADWVVVALGLVSLLVLVAGGLGGAGALQLRGGASQRLRTSRIAETASAVGMPVALALGVRLALEPGHGRSRVPVRPALVGAMVGVLGVVGAFTFRAGLGRAIADPLLYGQRLDAGAIAPASFAGATSPAVVAGFRQVAADPAVEMVDRANVAILTVDGRNVAMFGLDPLKGDFGVTTLAGREPRGPDEIVLGPQPQRALHLHVGDRVRVSGPAAGPQTFKLVGIGFNVEDGHTAYDQGGWITQAGFDRVISRPDQYKFVDWFVRFGPGVDKAAAIDRLNRGPAHGNLGAVGPVEDQQNLAGVTRVPLALGGFLALLAVAAVGHALATAVRRRRHDVAVLRVLGMRRTQARSCVAWQATTLAVVGLVIGIPAGMAAGRSIWRVVAHSTPMVYVAPLALVAAALVVPAAVAIANLLAAWPARLAARLRPAEVLRAE
jgi:ABC-type lipoprotein release transport system permease subunit